MNCAATKKRVGGIAFCSVAIHRAYVVPLWRGSHRGRCAFSGRPCPYVLGYEHLAWDTLKTAVNMFEEDLKSETAEVINLKKKAAVLYACATD